MQEAARTWKKCRGNNSVICMHYTLIKYTTVSQSESLLEWFKSDWLYKTKAVKNVKPSKFKNHQSSKTIKVQKPSKFIFSNTLQIKIVQHVEFNTFLKFFSFLYRIWKWNVQWNSAQSWLTKIHKLFHMTSRKQTVQGECFYEWMTAEFTRMWRSLGMTVP